MILFLHCETSRNESPSSGQREFQSVLSSVFWNWGGTERTRIVVKRPSAISLFGTAATRTTEVCNTSRVKSAVSCQESTTKFSVAAM